MASPRTPLNLVAAFVLFAISWNYLAPSALAQPITSLPGLSGQPNFKQYGGYETVDASHGRRLFYWLAESQRSPSTDPLVLWLQGGPGCSSLFGFFTESGPFIVNPDGKTLSGNPNSWNKVANMLYLDSPVGVGFSYSDTPSDYDTGDNKTMADSYAFLLRFFRSYPQFANNDFYVAGESYGGHYVPQLAWTILKGNAEGNPRINLKGMLVGNAWTDDVIDSNSVPAFIFSHALCSLATWQTVERACHISLSGDSQDSNANLVLPRGMFNENRQRELWSRDAACNNALNKMNNEVGNLINQYDIYSPCVTGAGLDCSNYTKETMYLNTPAVQTAIHAHRGLPAWSVCANINYTESWPSVVPIYPTLIKAIRVSVYGGDVTFNVPFLGSEVWIESLGRPIASGGDWKAWIVDGQVAGYVKKYDLIHWITVKNAGHMVPTYMPRQGFAMFERYLRGEL